MLFLSSIDDQKFKVLILFHTILSRDFHINTHLALVSDHLGINLNLSYIYKSKITTHIYIVYEYQRQLLVEYHKMCVCLVVESHLCQCRRSIINIYRQCNEAVLCLDVDRNPLLGSLNNCLTKLERRIMVDAKCIRA